ncbi:MAG: polymer-forming cytoskeletal protein [Thermodesulfovibrionia bacterium]|nr:polymer-forming cytoskeletal protein [Thermodesulfovibrionia bacterium]
MFKIRETKKEEINMNNHENVFAEGTSKKTQKINTILKGSKLTGDININYDLELSGEVEGNISSEENSNIVIKGVCKGNITTKEGNVEIEGELLKGDISAGGDVKITGKFNGGMVKAKGKITAHGEFTGKFESNEIEIGPNARGKGELLYKEYISIAKGAQIEAKISQIHEEQGEVKKSSDAKVISLERHIKEASGIT